MYELTTRVNIVNICAVMALNPFQIPLKSKFFGNDVILNMLHLLVIFLSLITIGINNKSMLI